MGVKMTGLRETQQGLNGFAAKVQWAATAAPAPKRKRRSRQAIANHIRRVMRVVMEQQNGTADFEWIVRLARLGTLLLSRHARKLQGKHGC